VAPLSDEVGNSRYKNEEKAMLSDAHFVGGGQIDNLSLLAENQ